jgi:hypothetical protein
VAQPAASPNPMAGIAQNGQPPNVGFVPTPQGRDHQMAQEGANEGQAELWTRPGY